jgi:hypothetical protein
MAAKRLGYDFTLEEDAARVEVRRRRPSLRGQFADLALTAAIERSLESRAVMSQINLGEPLATVPGSGAAG